MGNNQILLDHFLGGAIEAEADAICDGEDVYIIGIMEHVEPAGIHSGDSYAVLPPYNLGDLVIEQIESITKKVAVALKTVGLINMQFAIKNDKVYVIEANPRASRTIPFVSKATGIPLAKIAAEVMVGKKLKDMGYPKYSFPSYFSVKEAVFPFIKFPGADPILGPEMKSTGEVMGIGIDFGEAYAKAQKGANKILPRSGTVFISVKDSDKKYLDELLPLIEKNGFEMVATGGTAAYIKGLNYKVKKINKVLEGRPHTVDSLLNNEIDLVINTTKTQGSIRDSYSIRRTALTYNIPYYTTIRGAKVAVDTIDHLKNNSLKVKSLQDLI